VIKSLITKKNKYPAVESIPKGRYYYRSNSNILLLYCNIRGV